MPSLRHFALVVVLHIFKLIAFGSTWSEGTSDGPLSQPVHVGISKGPL